jgi:branched-chain amino acid transport system ATP-binding protein
MMAVPSSCCSARDLSVRFGGVLAVNNVSFDVRAARCSPDRPQRRRQDHGVQPDQPHLHAHQRRDRLCRPEGARQAHRAAAARGGRLGIARTFQNIELFEHATVLQNLLIGRHTHRQHRLVERDVLHRPPRARRACRRANKVERVIEFLDLQHHRDSMVAGLPYGVRKVVELARALCAEPRCCCWTSPRRA